MSFEAAGRHNMPIEDSLKVRNVSVRLPQDIFDRLVAVARVDAVTMGEVIREAIVAYADKRQAMDDWSDKVIELKRQLDSLLPPA
jgi:predicted DNA-binding protein